MIHLFRVFLVMAVLGAPQARAGVFNLPHFVPAGDFALGLEPELTLTSGAGLGLNAKFTQGLTDLSNVTGIVGTGSGPRRFRVGASGTFDFFPDIEGQPGIGVAAQVLYVRVPTPNPADAGDTSGQTELTAIPYIHKSFVTSGTEVEPYLAVPFGMAFLNGSYKALTSVVVGAMFKGSEHVRYVAEFGIAVNHTESYLSGGIAYYH